MEQNKSLNLTQIRRIHLLISLLKKHPYQSKDAILTYFEENDKGFNERTFYRLKEMLGFDFGIEIVFDNQYKGYFFDEAKSSQPTVFLNLLELMATAELFTSNHKQKNNSLSFVGFEHKSNSLTVPNFRLLLQAIESHLEITFKHYSFYHLKEEIYKLKPYFLKQYQNRWYIIGETEKGYRTFGIDRLEEITIGTKKFKDKTEEAKDKFSNVIGLNYADHKLEKIHLSFDISQKPYLESLPMHCSQKQVTSKNTCTFDIELLIHPNFEFRQQVLKYGSLVKVIEPLWLREEIKEEMRKGLEEY